MSEVKHRGGEVFVGIGSEAKDSTPVRWTGIAALIKPEPWVKDAACTGTDPDLWFPEPSTDRPLVNPKTICRECPVREQCLDYAMRRKEQFGIWGGLSADQMKNRRSRENARAVADAIRATGVFA